MMRLCKTRRLQVTAIVVLLIIICIFCALDNNTKIEDVRAYNLTSSWRLERGFQTLIVLANSSGGSTSLSEIVLCQHSHESDGLGCVFLNVQK